MKILSLEKTCTPSDKHEYTFQKLTVSNIVFVLLITNLTLLIADYSGDGTERLKQQKTSVKKGRNFQPGNVLYEN